MLNRDEKLNHQANLFRLSRFSHEEVVCVKLFRAMFGQVILVLLTGVLGFSQSGSTFSPVNPAQAQTPASDNNATPANATNPSATTMPVTAPAKGNGTSVPGSSSVEGTSAASSSSSSPTTAPANSPAMSATPVSAPAPGNAANPAGNNGSDTSQPPSATYARPLPGVEAVDVEIAPNTEMRATLDTPLSTRTSKSGDRFSATLVDPVRGTNGSVALPAGTRVEGEVADAEAGKVKPTGPPSAISALKGKGKLSVRFRDAVLPNGQTIVLNTSLVSVNRTGASAVKSVSRTGSVFPYGSSSFGAPIPGFAIGNLAGGGYILAIRSKDVDLPAQTGMVIRFDQPTSNNGTAPQQ